MSCAVGRTLIQGVSESDSPASSMILRKLGSNGTILMTRTWGIGLEYYGFAVTSQENRILQVGFTRLINGICKADLLIYDIEGKLLNSRMYGDTFESMLGA